MTAAAAPYPGPLPQGRALLWAAAGALALAAHAGALAWALRQPPRTSLQPDPAPAVMIDLEPALQAPQAPVETLTRDSMDAPEVEETVPPDLAELEPVDIPTEPMLPTEVPLPSAEPPPDLPKPVERPQARPREPVKEQPKPKKEPEPEPEKESKPQLRAQTTAPPAKQSAAPANASGSSAAAAPAKWQARLMAHLERRKRYPPGPRKRREEGTVLVRFGIDGNGNVLTVGLARSSGFAELDEAVLALVRRASPVPAPPPGAPHEITAPVRFTIR